VSDALCQVRRAEADDAEAVADLAAGLAQSFPFSRAGFGLSYPALLADGDACLLLAVDGEESLDTCWVSGTSPSTPTGRWAGWRRGMTQSGADERPAYSRLCHTCHSGIRAL